MVGNAGSIVLVGLGATALAAAVVWRQRAQRRRLARLEGQLDSSDPEQRTAGGVLAVSYGLGPAARALLPRMEHETHAEVRAAIALAIAHRQWEPGGSERVLTLRTWASAELTAQGYTVDAFGPAFTRISDMGGPQRPPYVPPAAAPPTAEAASTPAPAMPEEIAADLDSIAAPHRGSDSGRPLHTEAAATELAYYHRVHTT